MTCKDCLHYEACDRLADAKLGHGIMQVKTGVCKCFSDKSAWVNPPCKVGDTIFLPREWNGENGIARITILRMVLTEDESYIETDFDSDDYDYFMKYNCGLFWFEDFGEIVFTTKEKAEKALEKRRINK